MENIQITPQGICEIIDSLKLSTSDGPDGINSKLLCNTKIPTSNILTCIFMQSLQESALPYDWKVAKVIPICKLGEQQIVINYRPISLTSISCKILEHIIYSHIASFLETNGYFYKFQHGFGKHFLCETQLAGFVHNLLSNYDNGLQTDAIFLDFCKAFDKVPHDQLLYKLSFT